MALHVPHHAVRRNPSSSSLGSRVEHDNDLHTKANISRRNSGSSFVPAKPSPLLQSSAPPVARTPSPLPAPHLAKPVTRKATISLFAGTSHRRYDFPTEPLVEVSPYFKRILAETEGHDGSFGSPEQETYEDLDEFSMGLLLDWIQNEGRLDGPYDFHSLHHYLGLYILACKFEIEILRNHVMDLVRHYYSSENMTAPAFRIQYIYAYTQDLDVMRLFLVRSVAYRTLCETGSQPGHCTSESLRELLIANHEVMLDFVDALALLHKNGLQDPRIGSKCA